MGGIFPGTRDQLVECAALVRGMRRGSLEVTGIPDWPLDVLAQQIVAMAACQDWPEDALYQLVTRAWPYRNLPRQAFAEVIEMHAEGVARRAGRAQGARLHRDGVNKVVKARRGSRLAAITSGGAIPETAQCAVPVAGAEQIVRYLGAAREVLGALPTQRTLIAERFFDEAGGMQLVVHAPFGARQNRAFGLALRKRFCRTFDFELQAAATDEGILLSLGPQNSFPLETVFGFLSPHGIDEMLTQAALLAPMWAVRWRWNATRSLAVLRSRAGRKVPFNILRMRTDDLLAQVFPAQAQCQENAAGPIEPPDHPLVRETLRDCLTEAMDIEGLRALLQRMHGGELRLVARDTPHPSPLSHEILNSAPYAYLDDAPLQERRSGAVQMRRTLDARDASTMGALDPAAIAEVVQQAFPDVRSADELHDVLLTLGFLPLSEAPPQWQAWLEELRAAGRALCARDRWRAAERSGADLLDAVRGWVGITGPITRPELARKLGVPSLEAELAQLEMEGLVLRGRYRTAGGHHPDGGTAGGHHHDGVPVGSVTEWCERTLLARIHGLTLGRLRREIEPVSTQDFLRFLLRWQHVMPGTQLHGAAGLSQVLAQLQGFQAGAGAWESDLLPARVARYERALLDQLCYSGEIAWGRLSCAAQPDERRSPPGRSTRIALMRREDLPWLLDATQGGNGLVGERARMLLAVLEQRGALFPHELREQTGLHVRELTEALWELVSAGRLTCDGFAALRALLEPPAAPAAAARSSPSLPPRPAP